MPKVGTKCVNINEKRVDLILWYTQKDGFSYRGIPNELYKLTEFGKRVYRSEEEINTHLNESIVEYHEKAKTTKKIISYTLKATANLVMNRTGEYAYTGIKLGVSKKFETEHDFGNSFSFGFSYRVLMETSGTDKKHYYLINEDGSTGYECKNDGLCIDWTPAREQFFKDMAENLQKLVYGVSDFFDQPDLLQLMDTIGIKAISDGN